MKRVFLADAQPDELLAFRLILQDLGMQVVGEAADWPTVLAQAPLARADLLVIDWSLVVDEPGAPLTELRAACPAAVVIVLISHLDPRHQAALSAGADTFISKGETSYQVAQHLKAAVTNLIPKKSNRPDWEVPLGGT